MSVIPLIAGMAQAAEPAAGSFWMPPESSVLAPEIDSVFYFIYWLNVIFFVVMIGATGFFALKYKQSAQNERTLDFKGSHTLELIWAGVPTILLGVIFWKGFTTYIDSVVPPADSMDVRVVGMKWSWAFQYPDGVTSDTLKVPAGKNVRLTMNSKDVIHSFYVPDFRIKKDVLPNRYTVAWFNAPQPGTHHVFCTEYCGDGHSKMLNSVEVMEPAAFDAWLKGEANKGPLSGAALGEATFKAKGCNGCHTIDGNPLVGPTLKGKYGASETLEDGSTVTIDDNYIRESINVPAAKIVKGFAPSMPPFQGQISDDEMNGLIDYLKTLK